jgi:transposase-like protein
MVDTRLSRIYSAKHEVSKWQKSRGNRGTEPRRSFTEEFKREAVRLATERGNVSAVARDLGIHESVLNRWKRRLQEEADHLVRRTAPFRARGTPRMRR